MAGEDGVATFHYGRKLPFWQATSALRGGIRRLASVSRSKGEAERASSGLRGGLFIEIQMLSQAKEVPANVSIGEPDVRLFISRTTTSRT